MGFPPYQHMQEQAGQDENITLMHMHNCQGEEAASEYLISQLTKIQSNVLSMMNVLRSPPLPSLCAKAF